MRNKLILLATAITFKSVFLFITTLLFTGNVVSYTEYISHTSHDGLRFWLYLGMCDISVLVLIKKLSDTLFQSPDITIKGYLVWVIVFITSFFCIDLFFTIEIDPAKWFHHLICAISLATKYIGVYFIVAPSTLRLDPNQAPIIRREIFNYNNVAGKWINRSLFVFFSGLIYSKYKLIVFGAMLVLVNIASLYFYTSSPLLYAILILLVPFLFYSVLIQAHQVSTVMKFYLRYSRKTGIVL
jgi:hypothetical protein